MNFFKAGVSPAEAAIRDAVFKATTPAGAGEGDPAALVGLLQLLSQGGSLQSEMCTKHVKSRIKSEDAAVQVTSLVVLDRLLQLGDPRCGTSILAPLCLSTWPGVRCWSRVELSRSPVSSPKWSRVELPQMVAGI